MPARAELALQPAGPGPALRARHRPQRGASTRAHALLLVAICRSPIVANIVRVLALVWSRYHFGDDAAKGGCTISRTAWCSAIGAAELLVGWVAVVRMVLGTDAAGPRRETRWHSR
jgi:hypothetical protein